MRWPSVAFLVCLLPALAPASNQPITDEVDLQKVRKWVTAYGANLVTLARYVTAYDDFVNDFNSSDGIKLERANNVEIIRNISNELGRLFSEKSKALEKLVKVVEEAQANFTNYSSIDLESKEMQYWNAKFLTTEPPEANTTNSTNTTASSKNQRSGASVGGLLRSGKLQSHSKSDHDEELGKAEKPRVPYLVTQKSCHFDDMLVNTTLSTVHIPTNIYDGDAEIVSEAKWSESLDEVFRENFRHDPSLKWQYFASQSGLFRVFPGIKWPKKWNEDFYDCRTQQWYIQTAASPKDVVILVDNSGSMTGLRWQIAKKTIEGILNSLTANDFFAVVPFNSAPVMISKCGNDSLMQATAENKQYIKKELRSDSYQPKDIAVYPAALEFAFKLLRFNETKVTTDRSCNCNKAIMVISDGAPPGTDLVFAKYNSDQKIRVFSYLIGREVSDAKELRDMACNNRGYYVHVSTLADVAEYVQEYLHVMSRPMVISRNRSTIYTDVYIDPTRFPRGLLSFEDYMKKKLVLTVAQPVFDTRNNTRNQGTLLGVMGTDVPLHDIKKYAPNWKLGPNAYIILVTNNGHVVSHPLFRPKMFQDPIGMQRLPDYTDLHTDISELELPLLAHKNNSDYAANYTIRLRTSLIKAQNDEINQTTVGTYDSTNRRVFVRRNRYRIVNIQNVPYGLGLSMPQQYGYYTLDARVSRSNFNEQMVNFYFESSDEVNQFLAPYEFCNMKGEELNLTDPLGFILNQVQTEKFNQSKLVCDLEFLEAFFFDANATRNGAKHWNKTQSSEITDFVFIATRTGLIRYKLIQSAQIDHSFWPQIQYGNETVEAIYYQRTVENSASFPSANDTDGTCSNCFSTVKLTVTVETKAFVADEDEIFEESESNSTQTTASPDAKQQRLRAAASVSSPSPSKKVALKNANYNDTMFNTTQPVKPKIDERARALLTFTVPVERTGATAISAPIAVVGAQLAVDTIQSLALATSVAPCTVVANWTYIQPFQQICTFRSNPVPPVIQKAPPSQRANSKNNKPSKEKPTQKPPIVQGPKIEQTHSTFTSDDAKANITLQSLCDAVERPCFIVDENGFVVFSHHVRTDIYPATSYTGRFIGEIKGHYWLVAELTDKVFRRVEFVDYHAVCQRSADQKSSASSLLWKPVTWMAAAFQKLIANFIIMLVETDINWIYHTMADTLESFVREPRDESAAGSADSLSNGLDADDGAGPDGDGGASEAGEDHSGEVGASNVKYSKIKESCIEHMSLYTYTDAWKRNDSRFYNGSDVIAARVPGTNLLLIILRARRTALQAIANCSIAPSTPGCLAPISPPPAIPKTESCMQPFRETPRTACYKHDATEDSSKCTMVGAGTPCCVPLRSIVCLSFIVAFLLS